MSIQSVSRSFLWWCTVLLTMVLICLFIYRTGSALYQNNQLRAQFPSTASSSPYQQGIPIEKMDLTAYDSYFPNIFAALGYSLTHRIETPVTLRYYSEIPDDKAAFTLEIPKGTTIVAIPEGTTGSAFQEVGYGYTSFPTYDKGWRYVRPFVTADGVNSSADNEQYFYVSLDSLEAVLDKIIEANRPFHAAIRQQGWTLNKGKHVIARYVDNALYQHGAYLSKDMFYPVFDRLNVMLLGAIGVVSAVFIIRRGAFRRFKK